jgi:Cu-Zn family superoxide dismutase
MKNIRRCKMKMRVLLIALALSLSSVAVHAGEAPGLATAELMNPEGRVVGIAVITESPEVGVRITLNAYGLPPGPHGFHIHAVGKCEPPDFKSAAGHFNPYGRKHGLRNPEGNHAGDLLNLMVDPDGTAAALRTAPATLGPGKGSLMEADGTAIVIHRGPDDYMTDPAGEAGPRIACGVIRAVR